MPTLANCAALPSVNETKAERRSIMLVNEVKATEEVNLSSTPKPSEKDGEPELPIEAVLAILYTMARRLEKEALAQVITGRTPKGGTVTYIRMDKVVLDPERGFVLADRAEKK